MEFTRRYEALMQRMQYHDGINHKQKPMILTLNQLEEAAPYIHFKRLELILPNFNRACEKYSINNNYRVAHFLTQVLVESNYFRIIQEPGQGKEYENDQALGNTELGDGRRFIGRGYIKILGRKEYQEYKDFSKVDVITYPHFVTTPKVAMDIAGWIWMKKGLNEVADNDALMIITKALKGDYLIIREREEVLKKIRKALKAD